MTLWTRLNSHKGSIDMFDKSCNFTFKLMDYSIDGEEVSHSPRTQGKPQSDEVHFDQVRLLPPRSTTSPLMTKRPSRLNNHSRKLTVGRSGERGSLQDALDFAV